MSILKAKGLLNAIETDLDKSNAKDMVCDNAAFTSLTFNITDSQITHIRECVTAKSGWDALRIVHQGSGGRMVLQQRLWGLRIVDGEDLTKHLHRFSELASQLEGLLAKVK